MYNQKPAIQPEPELDALEERREVERFPCKVQPTWRAWGIRVGDARMASIHNISVAGISMRTKCRMKVGTVLVVKLQTPDQRLSRPLTVRVQHATAQPEGDWIVGCEFVRRLTERDLQVLLHET